MPALDDAVEDVVMQEWLVAVGDAVREGEPVCIVETDKVSVELLAPVTGTLTAVLVEDGATVEPGVLIAEFNPA